MNMQQDNLAYLKKYHPQIYNAVNQATNSNVLENYELIQNRNQSYNICIKNWNDSMLYSKYDPAYEAQRWCQSLDYIEQNEDDVILFGLGLTYHLSALIEQFPNRRFIIIEPEVGLFMQMIKIVDISQLLSHPNIKHIGVGKEDSTIEQFLEFIKKYCTFQYRYVRIPFYDKLSLETEKVFLEKLKKIDLEKKAVQGFHKTFGKVMYQNSLRNIPKLLSTPVLKTLEQRFPGSTAVIIGGGPSLQYDVNRIKENIDNWLIIAAGSSIQSLRHYGIQPHLIVSMDPGVYNTKIFRAYDYADIPMLVMPQIHHEILTIHAKNNVYAYYNNDPMINYLIPYQDQNYVLKPTFSVTGTAIQAAVYMGANRIIFTGQDLSYPNKQQYAAGAEHVTEAMKKNKEKELQYEVENVYGNLNPTTFSMLQTLKDIEQLIAEFTSVEFINASKSGAKIEGTTFKSIELITTSATCYNFNILNSLIEDQAVLHKIDRHSIIKKVERTVKFSYMLLKAISFNLRKFNELNKIVHKAPKQGKLLLLEIEESLDRLFNKEEFKEFIAHWFIVELNICEQHIIEAHGEQNVIKKAEIYNRSIPALLQTMKTWLPTITSEQEELIIQLKNK
ncbi:PseD protein [Paenibacillus montaniterrae]|uniref:PseD protein n=1 Tax=Paenibacillus montaniterrae TaxID=429341 RepID=A0A920D019_9BACL|nr:6-hydroxymethylpterin diphosphokinase MptE-like protein [Paenibacillus montaniterrae]GIP19100.1 PseD protein [Paenibacillus montaniterrae]